MKKILGLGMVCLMSLSLVGCGTYTSEIEGDLLSLITVVYSTDVENNLPILTTKEIASNEIEYYIGTNEFSTTQVVASESELGSYPHSVVLVRAKQGVDIEAFKTAIKNNVNSFKWEYVGVSEENVIVDNIGDLIVLIMDDNYSDQLLENFKRLEALKK